MPNSNNTNKPAPYTLMQLYKDLGAIMCDTPEAADIALGCECFTAYIPKATVEASDAALLVSQSSKLQNIGMQMFDSGDYVSLLLDEREARRALEFLPVGGVH